MAFRPSRQNRRTEENVERHVLNMMLNPKSGFELLDSYIPNDKAGGMTIIRLLNSFDQATGQEDIPAINPEGDSDTPTHEAFGAWVYPVKAIFKSGRDKLTCIAETFTSRDGRTVDDSWSIGQVLTLKMRQKLEEGAAELMSLGPSNVNQVRSILPQWLPFIGKFENGYFNEYWRNYCPMTSDVSLVQVMAYQIGGDVCVDTRTGAPCAKVGIVFVLPKGTVSTEFFDAVKTRRNKALPLDFANNLVGDVVTCAGGRQLMIRKYQKKADPRGRGKPSENGMDWAYSLGVYDQNVCYIDPAYAAKVWRPWDQLLITPCIEDVIEWMAHSFDWDLVACALRGTKYEEFVPKEKFAPIAHLPLATKADNRKAAQAPQQGQWPQQQGQWPQQQGQWPQQQYAQPGMPAQQYPQQGYNLPDRPPQFQQPGMNPPVQPGYPPPQMLPPPPPQFQQQQDLPPPPPQFQQQTPPQQFQQQTPPPQQFQQPTAPAQNYPPPPQQPQGYPPPPSTGPARGPVNHGPGGRTEVPTQYPPTPVPPPHGVGFTPPPPPPVQQATPPPQQQQFRPPPQTRPNTVPQQAPPSLMPPPPPAGAFPPANTNMHGVGDPAQLERYRQALAEMQASNGSAATAAQAIADDSQEG